MPRLPRLPLHLRLTLLIIASVSLLATAVEWGGRFVRSQVAERNIRTAIADVSGLLNMTVTPLSTAGDLDTLKAFLDVMLPHGAVPEVGLVYIVILDAGGKETLRSGLAPTPLPAASDGLDAALNAGQLHIRQPVLLADNQTGQLQFGYSTRGMAAQNERSAQVALAITVVGAALLGAFMLWFGWRLGRRIEHLAAAARQINSGDLAHRVHDAGSDEIAALAGDFNRMAGAVAERIAELAVLNATLEERVARRTEQLKEKSDALETNLATLRETRTQLARAEKLAGLGSLVAGIAHELNTPLGNARMAATTLDALSDSLRQEVARGLRKSMLDDYFRRSKEIGTLLDKSLERATDLIQRFKQVAVDTTSETPASFSLAQLVEAVCARRASRAREAGIQVRIDIDPGLSLRSYRHSLDSVLDALLLNALEHAFDGSSGGVVTVSAHATDKGLKLHLSDDGTGIAPEVLPRIFDPFFSTRFGQGSNGLGLNVVHNQVTMLLRGEIDVTSMPGQGARFTLDLPTVQG